VVAALGRRPLPREKVEEVKRLLREGHSCREVSRMTGVSLGKVGEIRKSMGIAATKEVGRSREGPSGLEEELSKVEQRLLKVENMLSDLFSALESAYRGRVDPKLGCLLIGRYEGAKCIFENPSKLQCALCPYYVSKLHILAIPKEVVEGLKALAEILSSIETPVPRQPASTGGAGEKPKDAIEKLEASLEDLESKRAKLKEVLEKMGFKVEDLYMRRDEVERLIEEARKKAFEEALKDKWIDVVEDIIRDVIPRLVELFRPAVQAFFMPAPATPVIAEAPKASEATPALRAPGSGERKVAEARAPEGQRASAGGSA